MSLFDLQIQPVGQITQVGETYVFGLAQHHVERDRTDTVYLNLAGPTTSVEAVWAGMIEHRTTALRTNDYRTLFVKHGGVPGQEKGESPYLRFQRRIPGLSIDHLILVDRRFAHVEYRDIGLTYLFDTPNLSLKLGNHVRQLVNIAVFPVWLEALTEAGREERLLAGLNCLGHTVYLLHLDRTRWEHLISLKLEKGELPWPG
jgi:hypothetical protein